MQQRLVQRLFNMIKNSHIVITRNSSEIIQMMNQNNIRSKHLQKF